MPKSYLIIGESGEYSDWSMWIVCGFDRKRDAEARLKLMNDWIAALPRHDPDSLGIDYEEVLPDYSPEARQPWDLDPQVSRSRWNGMYIGSIYVPKYHVQEVDRNPSPPRPSKKRFK